VIMELGMIGLGRMGSNMTRRLLDGGHRVVVYDPNEEAFEALVTQGATGSASIPDLVGRLAPPRAVWLMVPSGETTETTINTVAAELSQGDAVIDGYGD
jgi:6-phosphogluconate dehydrogenase